MTPTHEPGSPADQDASRTRALSLLGEVFSSKVRASLLAWIVPRLDTRFSLTELSRELGMPISSLQHECYKLERLGVLKGRRPWQREARADDQRVADRLDHILHDAEQQQPMQMVEKAAH